MMDSDLFDMINPNTKLIKIEDGVSFQYGWVMS